MLQPLAMKALVAVAGIGIAVGSVTVDAPPEDPTCKEAREWVESHSADLPTSLDAISELPVIVRRLVFAEISVAERRDLWREHLDTFLTDDSPLTEYQKHTVRSVQAQLDDLIASKPPHDRVDRLAAQVEDELGVGLGSRIFAMLGPVGNTSGSSNESAATASCNCCSSCTFTCTTITGPEEKCTGSGCGFGSVGCGLFWISECDGVCAAAE